MPDAPPPRRLLDLLDLTPAGRDRFLAATPGDGPPRLFGGQVAAQSLHAACRTVPADRPPHSLHAYFVRPGRPGVPLQLDVSHTRDGRSFTTRHVTASQDGEEIFVLTASFHVAEEGTDWQGETRPEVPDPDDIEPADTPFSRFHSASPFEVRLIAPVEERFVLHPCWIRIREELPEDPALHCCALTYVSDMGVVSSARAPLSNAPFMGASLDHAVWFHRPVRADDWLLLSVDPVTNYGARGLARGRINDRAGTLVASVAQEALLRPSGTVPLP